MTEDLLDQPLGAKALYDKLEPRRQPFLMRAHACASLTIPSLIPPQGSNHSTLFATPFQSLGARGVNNLASKLLITLLPPNSPFFRLVIPEQTLNDIGAVQAGLAKSEVEESLATIEREVQAEIETAAMRVPAFEALKHLVVAGNALCFIDDDGAMRVFHLSQYVVERDPMGSVLAIVTREQISPAVLPDALRTQLQQDAQQTPLKPDDVDNGSREPTIELYTHVCRDSATWFSVYQEVRGHEVPGSRGRYRTEELPFIPLRFNHISGEDYGRGHVEEYLGDLQSLEGLAQAIVEGSAAAARVLFLCNPNGTTRQKKLAEAPNGGFVEGNADDVKALQLDKFNDFKVAAETAKQIRDDLSFAFLLNSAIQRNGERVTAEEIRFMAGELEDTLGGVYSILSQEFQLPLVRRVMAQMTRKKLIPKLPKTVRAAVVTGMEALGRGHDLNRLQTALGVASAAFTPAGAAQYLKPTEAMRRIFTAAGVETKDLIKTEQELQQEADMRQKQAMVEKLGPNAVTAIGNHINQAAAAVPTAGAGAQPQPQQ